MELLVNNNFETLGTPQEAAAGWVSANTQKNEPVNTKLIMVIKNESHER